MMFQYLLEELFGARTKLGRNQRFACGKRPKKAPRRLVVEHLEDRLTPATITVTNVLDTTALGDGVSLREAIQSINAGTNINADVIASGTYGINDTINFNIATSGVQTIHITSQLDAVTRPVVIDGYTEAGSRQNDQALMGQSAGDDAVQTVMLVSSTSANDFGLVIAGGNSTVEGLLLQSFTNGIHLVTNGNDVIEGNQFSSIENGVFIDNVANNTIGGTTAAARNIVDNCTTGIQILHGGATGNVVEGNYLGGFADGVNSFPDDGISVSIESASNNVVGGSTAGAGNVIGADYVGVVIYSDGPPFPLSQHNFVQGNYIGIDATGTHLVGGGDGSLGVWLIEGFSNTIGGPSPGEGNVIAGFSENVLIEQGSSNNLMQGNYVGTDAVGMRPTLAPLLAYSGKPVGSGTTGFQVGIQLNSPTAANTIGGMLPGEGNLIADNPGNGIEVYSSANILDGNTIADNGGAGVAVFAGVNNRIEGNETFANKGLGIDLGVNGVTPNLPGGPFVPSNYVASASVTQINTDPAVHELSMNGTIQGVSNTTYIITSITFQNTLTGPSVNYTASSLSFTVPTDPSGNGSFSVLLDIAGAPPGVNVDPAGWYIPIDGIVAYNYTSAATITEDDSGPSPILDVSATIQGLANTTYTITNIVPQNTATGSGTTYPINNLNFAVLTDSSGIGSFSGHFPLPDTTPYTTNPAGWLLPYGVVACPPHLGPNYLQNYPVLASVSSGAGTLVSGTLNGQKNTQFTVDFFSNPAHDPSGYGQGQTYLGSTTVSTDDNGNVTFAADLAFGNLTGQWITATATDPNGNTSEFSKDVQATADANATFAQDLQAALPQSSSVGNSMTIQVSTNATPATVISAVNGLTNISQPVTIILDLGGGTYSTGGVSANPPPNVTLVIQNGTLDPSYPALTVAGGRVSVLNTTLTTNGNNPTILITGGTLTMRNDIVQESTSFSDAAIAVTGGTVDLGTASSPGNNTININGAGQMVQNSTGNPISAVGNTFESGGAVTPAPSLSFTALSTNSSSTIPGQSMTFTATVKANGSGTPTGTIDFYDTTTSNDLGTATVSNGVATLMTSTLAGGAHLIRATYSGDNTFQGSLDSLTQTVQNALYLLDKTASGALSLSGNAGINVPGAVIVDSSSKTALTESGNASITAGSIQVVGGVSKSGNASLSPAATTGVAFFANPLASLNGPSTSGLTNYGSVSVNGNSSRTLNPGIYTQISVSGNAKVTLNPGLYLIEGGGVTVSGNASLTGTNIMIYNTSSNYPLATGSYGGITLSGNGTFRLTAPTTNANGVDAGIVIFQPTANTRALSLSGTGAAGITGTVYAPSAQVVIGGNATLSGSLVADELSMSGNGVSTQVADGSSGSEIDTAGAGTLLAGNLYVYVSDPAGYFTANELSRIRDAINAWNNLLAPYNVTISEVTDSSLANVTIDDGITSAAGAASDGVLGCYNSTGEITILQGWNWYDGSDPTQIGANQYDFQTVMTHELGHALGLGGSNAANSPMNEMLAAATTRRTPAAADLNVPPEPDGADAERAAPMVGMQTINESRALATEAVLELAAKSASIGERVNAIDSPTFSVATAAKPIANPSNNLEGSKPPIADQAVASDATIDEPAQGSGADSWMPVSPSDAPVVDPPPTESAPSAIPSTVANATNQGGDNESLAAILASDTRETALRQQACDALFTEDDWTPQSATIVAGSVFAVALAANPTLVGGLVRERARRRWTMSVY
jgi:parallel beta-helix repeat protein